MLSWSAEESDRLVNVAALVGDGDPGISAGKELVAVGRAAVGIDVDAGPVASVAAILGEQAAVYSAEVAGAFELLNRAVDAVGLRVGAASRIRMAETIEVLGLGAFPHAEL